MQQRRSSIRGVSAAVLGLALIASGCSTDRAGTGTERGSLGAPPINSSPGPTPEVADTREMVADADDVEDVPEELALRGDAVPVVGAVLRLAVVTDPPMDPLLVSAVTSTDMVVADLLYDGLTEWDTEAGTWAPRLGVEFVVADDGFSWTVELTPARFSDGSALDAHAVKRSLDRVLGAELTFAAARLDMVEEIVAVDATTLRFELREPYPFLPELLSSPLFGIVPDGEVDGSVGSGPLVLAAPAQLRPREGVALSFGGVDLVKVDSAEQSDTLRAAGAVDMAFVPSAFVGAVDVTISGLVEAHYVLNTGSLALLDVEVRRAVVGAIDVPSVVLQAFGSGAVPIEPLDSGGAGSGVVDLEVAALEVSYIGDARGQEQALAEALVEQLVAAGIETSAVEYDLASFVELVASGQHDLIRSGWVGLFPSPDSQLMPYQSQSPDNVSSYASEEFDALLAEAQLSGDPAAYEQARELLGAGAVVLPVARFQVRVLLSESVEGLRLRPDGSFDALTLMVFG